MAVFRVGGIDAVLDILTAVLAAVAALASPSGTMAYIVTEQLIPIPVLYLQSLNHCLVYNIDIREKMLDCIKPGNKHSKVIVLHRE